LQRIKCFVISFFISFRMRSGTNIEYLLYHLSSCNKRILRLIQLCHHQIFLLISVSFFCRYTPPIFVCLYQYQKRCRVIIVPPFLRINNALKYQFLIYIIFTFCLLICVCSVITYAFFKLCIVVSYILNIYAKV